MPSRRDFLRLSAAGAASLALPTERLAALAGDPLRPFQVPLRIPPVAEPVLRAGGRDLYEMTMREARVEMIPGVRTTIWGFDGRFPGPTFKVKRGREVVVRRINRLKVPTTTHLHGGKVPWKSDGHPSLLIPPGGAYEYVYPNDQEAATLWYHDHLCKKTSRNTYMGLAGMYIIEDEEEESLNLPRGRYDVPLVLQDRDFNKRGELRFRDAVDEILGNVVLVNGRPTPYMKVAARKYRFRILNASHTRGYRLALDNRMPLIQIASDQGLLTAPYPAPDIPLWPAERAEVIVDFSLFPVGTSVVLHDLQDPTDPASARPVMRFDVAREAEDTSSLPPVLRPVERLLPGPGTVRREFVLSQNLDKNRWEINGKPFDAARVDAEPRLGDTEIWTFVNRSSMVHPMHVHLVRFQILERSNAPITPGELGWKDTVRVDPSANSVSIIMRFEGFTGRYMFHCHNLAHEDHSMMGQMLVRPGDDATARAAEPEFAGGYAAGRAGLPFRCDFRS
jgi:spore coat protein A, manganese oxidase